MWQPPRGAILVGVDGSASALGAVRWAAHDAALRHAPLILVQVIDAAVPEWLAAAAPAGFGRSQDTGGHDFIEAAVRVAEETAGGLEIDGKVLHSAIVPTLVRISGQVQMIVVGFHGRGGALVRSVLGSVSSALTYHAQCPVAVTHDQPPRGDIAKAPVLVGIDGSPASEAATAIAFDEAARRGVGLLAMHVWADPRVCGSAAPRQDSGWDAQLSEEEATLAERLAGWHDRYPDVAVHPEIAIGDPARWLIEASKRAQLVVVGSHGAGFSRRLLGSVSAAVVNRTEIPVIVARQS